MRSSKSSLLLLAFSLTGSMLLAQTAEEVPASAPTSSEVQMAAKPTDSNIWWKHAFVYEIYPRSFQDTNGDGIGDLNGITERLPYLQKLGVDAIWIAPMFPSPQVDFGYDVSNYEAVDPQYGTMADMDRLIAEGKKHNVRILLDFVLNHTSDKHAWFEESASSRTNPKADWYDWSDGVKADTAGLQEIQKKNEHDGMVPPNNWESLFGGSAWTWVPARKQFYYHKFYVQQPDLNWDNPAVEKAMFDQMRFWLDKGVAGFRLDAVPTLFEDKELRNEPVLEGTNAQGDPNLNDEYTNNLPRVHDVSRRMRAMVEKYPGNRVLIGETYLPNTAELKKWYGAQNDELNLPMDMLIGFHTEGGGPNSPNISLNPQHFARYINEMDTELQPNWPLLVFDNHDNPRSWDRFSTASETEAQKVDVAKIIATMLFTAKATAMSYYGAEIGMVTSTPTRKEDVKDPIGITGWPREKGRDGERTPMQWTPGPQAGFSKDAKTWLPVASDYKTVNVQTEEKDPNSLLNWYEQMTALRRSNPALHDGGFVLLKPGNDEVVAWVRTAPAGARPVVVAMNMSAQPQTVTLDLSAAGISGGKVKTLAASAASLNSVNKLSSIELPPYSSWVAAVQ